MKWRVHFNRGTKDWSQAWVIEQYDGAGTQYLVAAVKIKGAWAETQTAPDGSPQGFLVIYGNLVIENQVAEFLQ